MKIGELFTVLDQRMIMEQNLKKPDIRLRQVCLLTLDSFAFSEDTVYLTKWSEFCCMNVEKAPSVFVIVMDEPAVPGGSLPENYILMSEDVSCHSLYYTLMQKIETSERVTEAKLILSHALLDGVSVSGLLEIAAHLLGNPVIIQDFTTRMVLHSQVENPQFDDEILDDLFSNGFVSSSLFEKYDYDHVLKQIEDHRDTFLLQSEHKSDRLICRLMVNHTYFGWILSVASCQPFRDGDIELMNFLSQAITILLDRENIFPASNHAEMLLGELLGSCDYTETQFEERAAGFSWFLKRHYYVLTVQEREDGNQPIQKRTMLAYKNYLTIMFPDMRSIYYERGLILFFDRNSLDGIIEPLEKILIQYGLCAGVSARFSDITEFRERFRHGTAALEIGKKINPERVIYHFQDYCLYDAVCQLAVVSPIQDYCSQELIGVYRYDKENGTNFAESERIYLMCRSITIAAKKLNIHRNTMVYRITKFAELSNLDVSQFHVREKLAVSYRILDMFPEIIDDKSADRDRPHS